jgi:hypothetical protein
MRLFEVGYHDLEHVEPVEGFKIRLRDVMDALYRRYPSLLHKVDEKAALHRQRMEDEAARLRNTKTVEKALARHPATAKMSWEAASELASGASKHHLDVYLFVNSDRYCSRETFASFVEEVAAIVRWRRKHAELTAAATARGYAPTPDDVTDVMERYLAQKLSVEQGVALVHDKLSMDAARVYSEWKRLVQKLGPNATI